MERLFPGDSRASHGVRCGDTESPRLTSVYFPRFLVAEVGVVRSVMWEAPPSGCEHLGSWRPRERAGTPALRPGPWPRPSSCPQARLPSLFVKWVLHPSSAPLEAGKKWRGEEQLELGERAELWLRIKHPFLLGRPAARIHVQLLAGHEDLFSTMTPKGAVGCLHPSVPQHRREKGTYEATYTGNGGRGVS